MDLDFLGTKFTWPRPCRGRMVSKRLGRCVCDHGWRMIIQAASVQHLIKRQSDHNPLIMRCIHQVSAKEARLFRFQAAWCTHGDYSQVINRAWNKCKGRVVAALNEVNEDSIVFNRDHFGNIFERNKQLEARLRGIQRTLEEVDLAKLSILQKNNYYNNMKLFSSKKKLRGSKSKGKLDQVRKQKYNLFPHSNNG